MSVQITNPLGAYGYTTSLDGQSYSRIVNFKANGTITKHDAVCFEAITADDDGLPTVIQADVSAHDPVQFVGVAQKAAVAGEVVPVCIEGLTLVNIDNATVAAFNPAHFHASADGCLDGTTLTATEIVGDYMGIFLSANDVGGTNKAFLWVTKL